MRIAIAADHRGYLLRRSVMTALRDMGHEVLDLGQDDDTPSDYPDAARSVCEAMRDRCADRGVLLCGSGAGVSIAANKFPGIRAAMAHDCYTAHQSVEHDDANVICLGAFVVGEWLALDIVRAFVNAEFQGLDRQRRRVEKVQAIENQYLTE
jgi:ribose 5-phosphate isomerase B